MGTSSSSGEKEDSGGGGGGGDSGYYHNVLFLQEYATSRTTAFHFHAGQYETFTVGRMPGSLVILGYTTLDFDEVDRVLRDNTYRTTTRSCCYPPLCWTHEKLREFGVPVINNISATTTTGYNRLFYGTMVSKLVISACPMETTDL